jgi:hypothetical protein
MPQVMLALMMRKKMNLQPFQNQNNFHLILLERGQILAMNYNKFEALKRKRIAGKAL